MSGSPVQQYVPPSPYTQPPPAQQRKGFPTVLLIVVIIIVVTIALVVIGAMFFFSAIDNIGEEPWEEIETVEDEIYIDEGGHYWLLLTDGWSDEFQLNMTINSMEGGPFDVYIMTRNQYDNAYGNQSTGAFSSTFERNNVSSVIDIYLTEDPVEPLYLVIDNVQMPHVPGNALPDGTIQVRVDLDLVHRFEGW